ncbi:MAG: glycoside hydrolase family 20 zincin-like fold domain-containing protein, partial [Bacteroides sp.]|nr:glycoside hydrolase family 20 zincin-like fold domain-containing protein [Bacteroides sp.]
MYSIKTTISVFLLTALLSCGSLSAQRVIPVPRQVEQQDGRFRITEDTKIYTNLKGEEKERLLVYLSSQPSFLNRKVYVANRAEGNAIFLQKRPVAGTSSEEAYTLEVNAGGVTIFSA